MPTALNIDAIQAQLIANADQVADALTAARAERDRINADIRQLVADQKKAERLAAVIRREIEKQAESEAAVASVTPTPDTSPAFEPVE